MDPKLARRLAVLGAAVAVLGVVLAVALQGPSGPGPFPWEVTEGLRAQWVEQPGGGAPPRLISMKVVRAGEHVELAFTVQRGATKDQGRYLAHRTAVPVAVASAQWGTPLPPGPVRWTQEGESKWQAKVGGYVVEVTLRAKGAPRIACHETGPPAVRRELEPVEPEPAWR